MKYKPTIQGYKWITATTSNNGNGGLNDQEAFKSAVAMLEVAIDEWHSPRLVHLILTGATAHQYDSFIKRVKRDLAGIKYSYKGCTESASNRGGLHQHFMFVHDADDSTASPFDDGNDSSALSRATTATQRMAPDFKVTVAQPYSHDTPYMPLTSYTLQNAACWQSYIFKQRSKQPDHRYLSSRAASRTCH